ncbi:TonB-dependent receptor [Sphingomonas sp. HITSZ_GF]|uniref:TonB-dependent receptor n=1 Tax=Sphingomonas sp. HITSZ_GF TaxID=3037247 RepID=UPI00240E2798|nr:TonB-dependent receptor [Sphingomonas sp. HITSZ_GF]MDG2533891.1 TonB-dependent receptor [Sphingomonas sp. HITSZ_GF]
MKGLACTSSLIALVAALPAAAQTGATPPAQTSQATPAETHEDDIVVTATRRNERLQDVPLSVTAFSQEELTQKGIVGFEGIARETPGVALNKASDNNARFTTRGISTNGWGAGLQTTTTVYLDELPLTTIGNSITLDSNLFDVQRVEFLRGPQGTLFGSGSLSGAMRILTKSPNLKDFDASALVDIGWTPDGDGIRQRYNGMLNVPLVEDKFALRAVGYYRHEDGFIDNIGTGKKNANTLKGYGGRAALLFKPSDRLSIKLMGAYENSGPEDASMVTPSLGDRKRYSLRPDRYTSETQIYNGTIDYDFDFAHLVSSSTWSVNKGDFDVDLGGTFGATLPIPFLMDDDYQTKTFVQEARLVSKSDGRGLDWVIGGFYMHRDLELAGRYQSTPAYLTAKGITGLTDSVFQAFGSNTKNYELAGFGELTYHLTDTLSVSGGLRYGKYGATVTTRPGFNTAYFTYALYGIAGPLAKVANAQSTAKYPSAERASWKASLTWRPTRDLTAYATVSTGYRTPVYNARAGSVSVINPADLVIPQGATSDNLTNYEVGLKGRWLGGRLTAALAAYYIDWRNIQVQANRLSDSVQFATNVGAARSQGLEAEITFTPTTGLTFGLNGSLNDAKVTKLSTQESQISGAVLDQRLSSPHVQGTFYGTYTYGLGGDAKGFSSFQIQHVGSFPNMFPNTPGTLGVRSPLYDFTDTYTVINLQTGVTIKDVNVTLYVENLGNSRAVTYIHPEAFVYSRYAILRPRTFGIRLGYNLW